MIDETYVMNISEVPGYAGPLFDDQPRATPSRVRPFIWAFLLLRGAVRRSEVVGAITGHVCGDDCRIGMDEHAPDSEQSVLDRLVDEQLGAFITEGILRLSRADSDLYVISPLGLQRIVSIACSLDAQLPDHLLSDLYAPPSAGRGEVAATEPPDAGLHQGPAGRGLHGRGLGQRVRAAIRSLKRLGLAAATAQKHRLQGRPQHPQSHLNP